MSKKTVCLFILAYLLAMVCECISSRIGDVFMFPLKALSLSSVIAVLLVFPCLGIGKWLRVIWGLSGFGAYAIGAILVMAIIPLLSFLLGCVIPLNPAMVLTLAAVASITFFLLSRRGEDGSAAPTEYHGKAPFHDVKTAVLFSIVVALFTVAVCIPFIGIGYDDGQGIAYPSVGDYSKHSALIASIAYNGLPAQNPFCAPQPLRYPFFYHLFAADVILATGGLIGIDRAYIIVLLFFVPAFMYCLYYLLLDWFGSRSGAWGGVLFCSWIGGLDMIPIALYRLRHGEWLRNIDGWERFELFKIHSPITNFLYVPHHLFAALLFFVLIYLFTVGRKRWLTIVTCGLIFGAIIGYSFFICIAAMAIIAGKSAFSIGVNFLKKRRFGKAVASAQFGEILSYCMILLIGMTLVSPLLLTVNSMRGFGEGPRLKLEMPPLNTVMGGVFPLRDSPPILHILGVIVIELFDFSPMLLCAIAGIFALRSMVGEDARRYILSALFVSLFLLNCVTFKGSHIHASDWSMKIGIVCWLSLGVAASAGIGRFIYSNPALRDVAIRLGDRKNIPHAEGRGIGMLSGYLAAIGLMILLAVGAMGTIYEVGSKAIPEHFSPLIYQGYVYVRNELPRRAIVQRGIYDPTVGISIPSWGWRRSLLSDYPRTRLFFPDPGVLKLREQLLGAAFGSSAPDATHKIFKEMGIDYIFWTPSESAAFGENRRLNFKNAAALFDAVYENDECLILKVK